MRFLFCFVLLLFLVNEVVAQTMSVRPKSVQVEAGSSFDIEYIVENAGNGQFVPPNFDQFTVVSGPNSYSSMQWINGKTSSIKRFTYSLVPKKTGNLTLHSAGYQTSKTRLKAPNVPVKVTGRLAQRPNGLNKTPKTDIAPDDSIAAAQLPDVFYKIEVDTDKVYVGEQLTAYYVLYSSNGITNYSSINAPAQTGFWVEDITPSRINSANAVFGNRIFQKYVIKKFALFPQRSGTLEIDNMKLEVAVRQAVGNQRQRRSFFQHYSTKNIEVECPVKTITVLPLPEGAPEGFKGAVGSYKLNVRPSSKTCTLGESIDLNIGVLGNGNLKLIEAVEIPESDDYEVYDPTTTENIRAEEDLVLGTKTFEYAIIPKKTGEVEIPPLRLSYFNPRSKRYEVKESPRTVITVVPGDGTQGVVMDEPEEEVGLLGIKTEIQKLSTRKRSAFPYVLLGGLFVLPFLLMPMVVMRKRKADEASKDVVGIRRSRASKVAQERLSTAKSLIGRKEKKAFYNEITKTIEGYCGDKFNMPASSLSKEVIVDQLQEKAIPESLIGRLKAVMEYCEMVLFAPVADADNLQKTYDETLEVISAIESSLEGDIEK